MGLLWVTLVWYKGFYIFPQNNSDRHYFEESGEPKLIHRNRLKYKIQLNPAEFFVSSKC